MTPSAHYIIIGHRSKASCGAVGNFTRIGGVPQRAPPLPVVVVRAMVGYLLDHEEPQMAFLVALAYRTYLRTGEILRLRNKDILLDQHRGVVSLEPSKSGLCFSSREAIAIYDPGLLPLWELCHLPTPRRPEDLVWRRSAQAFRCLFYQTLRSLGVEREKFQPYKFAPRRRNSRLYVRRDNGVHHPTRKMEIIISRKTIPRGRIVTPFPSSTNTTSVENP